MLLAPGLALVALKKRCKGCEANCNAAKQLSRTIDATSS
jgi:hypothetical protein